MPSVFCWLTVIGLLTFIRYDSPQFYLYSKDNDHLAKKAIHKMFVTEGMVSVNDEIELRKRRKLRDGDIVVFDETNKVFIIKR